MDKRDDGGIEVSAQELLVSLRRSEQAEALPLKSFPNNAEGHQAIAHYLIGKGRVVRVCLESTGVYGLDLALFLEKQAGIEVMVANPRAARNFGQALMQRSKTDPLDALTLMEFAARMPFRAWQPPSKAALHLGAIARRLASVTEIGAAEKNRLHAAGAAQALPEAVRQDLKRSMAFHQRALERLTGQARKLIAADALLEERFKQLDSIPGVGTASAIALLAELSMLAGDLDVRQWVASAGLDPRQHSSGSSVQKKPRISKAGNRHLRRALFMPALVAVRFDPHLGAYYQRLLARGKVKMQALVAVMRKLLHAIYGMFKHRECYEGSKVFPLLEQASPTPTSGVAA